MTSAEMEAEMRKLSDAHLAELAFMNDSPKALKARGEIARRNSVASHATLFWARIAGFFAIAAAVIALIAWLIPIPAGS